MKHIIIGGVAGGATAAARIRRNDEKAEIVLLEKGQYISYANCGLPYYIGDVITERENLFVQTPESFGKRFNIDVRVMNEAVAIHPEQKKSNHSPCRWYGIHRKLRQTATISRCKTFPSGNGRY